MVGQELWHLLKCTQTTLPGKGGGTPHRGRVLGQAEVSKQWVLFSPIYSCDCVDLSGLSLSCAVTGYSVWG